MSASGAEQRFDFFDGPLGPGTWTSNPIPRGGNNLVIEAFPVGTGGTATGTATATVLDAANGAQLTQATDSASGGPPLSAYTKWMVRGLLPQVALKVVVTTGLWSFSGAFTNEASTVARQSVEDRNDTPILNMLGMSTALPGNAPLDTFINNGVTIPGTYHVPANRKAVLLSYTLIIRRNAVATTPGMWQEFLSYQRSGSPLLFIDYAMLGQNAANQIGTNVSVRGTPNLPLLTGDSVGVNVRVSGESADGGANCDGSVVIHEFDA